MSLHTNIQLLKESAAHSIPPKQRVYNSVSELIADPDNPTPMIRLSERFNSISGF